VPGEAPYLLFLLDETTDCGRICGTGAPGAWPAAKKRLCADPGYGVYAAYPAHRWE